MTTDTMTCPTCEGDGCHPSAQGIARCYTCKGAGTVPANPDDR